MSGFSVFPDRRSVLRLILTVFPAAGLSRAAADCTPTLPDQLGPFHLPGAPFRARIAEASEPGTRLLVAGTVTADDCRSPLANAVLDIWQADARGEYHNDREQYRLRGQVRTDGQGRFEFSTIKPGNYDMGSGMRPAHIHVTITHPDYEALTTQLYFAGDPYLGDKDACGSECNASDPKRIATLKHATAGTQKAEFNIALKPNRQHRNS